MGIRSGMPSWALGTGRETRGEQRTAEKRRVQGWLVRLAGLLSGDSMRGLGRGRRRWHVAGKTGEDRTYVSPGCLQNISEQRMPRLGRIPAGGDKGGRGSQARA